MILKMRLTDTYRTPPRLMRTPVRIALYRLQASILGFFIRTVLWVGCTDQNRQNRRLEAVTPEMYGCTDQLRGIGELCHV